MQKEYVVLAINSAFKSPNTQEEAAKRLREARATAKQLEDDLKNKHVTHPHTGERMNTEEYFAWKKGVRRLLAKCQQEVFQLKDWWRVHVTPHALAQQQDVQIEKVKLFSLLWRTNQVLHRLTDNDLVVWQPSEQALLQEIDAAMGLKQQQVLEEARACLQGGIENVSQFGSWVAQATGDRQDLSVLARAWKEAADTQEEASITCARGYISALLAFGEREVAIQVARSLNQDDVQILYIWSEIAEATDDEALVRQLRVRAHEQPAPQRGWFYLRLYALFGNPEDATLAMEDWRAGQLGASRPGLFQELLIKEHAGWHRLEAGREMLSQLQDPDRQLRALCSIAEYSEDDADMNRLLQMLEEQSPTRIQTIKEIVALLAQSNYSELAESFIASLPDWYMRCAGYSVLARFKPECAESALDRAEQALREATSSSIRLVEVSYALYSLVYAQAMNGREKKALRCIRQMTDRVARCKALLVLHLFSQGEPIPALIEKEI